VPDLSMSGLVHLSSLEDDFYLFDSARSQLIGRRNRRVIRLGDKVEVQIATVNTFKKQVDFRLAKTARDGPSRLQKPREPERKKRPIPAPRQGLRQSSRGKNERAFSPARQRRSRGR
jgi:ribonuclease R